MPLPRLQLFELEDLAWFPRTIRDLATDYLHFMQRRFSLHAGMVPLVRKMLAETGTGEVVDLCSGGGGPVLDVYESLVASGTRVHITLTDRYPNLEAFGRLASKHPSDIGYAAKPVDARETPRSLRGLRTMFNAFHHFAPTDARLVLSSAVDARQPIGIFEIPERSPVMMLSMLLTPAFVLVATPFIRPFQGRRLLWTYLIPVIPLVCGWDGMVSSWRSYGVAEMLTLTQGLDEFEWTAARVGIPGSPGHLTYLLGAPR